MLGKLTSKTDPRTSVKGQILPSVLRIFFPSLGPEGSRVGTPEVCTAVHCEDIVCYHLAFADVDWGALVWAAAGGEGCVFSGGAEVDRDGGLEAEDCFIKFS
jgi:hypothetical protein